MTKPLMTNGYIFLQISSIIEQGMAELANESGAPLRDLGSNLITERKYKFLF
jgi:hypothetical protein